MNDTDDTCGYGVLLIDLYNFISINYKITICGTTTCEHFKVSQSKIQKLVSHNSITNFKKKKKFKRLDIFISYCKIIIIDYITFFNKKELHYKHLYHNRSYFTRMRQHVTGRKSI